MKKILSIVLTFIIICSCIPCHVQATDADVVRDTVLVLDNSVSLEGTPLSALKQSAIKFCNQVLEANGKNKVAIVVYDTNITSYCEFTDNITQLTSAINSMDGQGSWTNINAGIIKADEILSDSSATIKNIVIMSDGLPTAGDYLSEGRYSSSDYSGTSNADHYCYEYANAVYETAVQLFYKYGIYSLGFFHSMEADRKVLASKLLKDIQNNGYYEVIDPEELQFVFGDIADNISNETKKITFTYASSNDKTATCYYSNNYFANSSYVYNSSLATMSMSLAWSAFGSSDGGQTDYSNKSKNAKQLLQDIGVPAENIETNDWFTKKPTTDSIGVIAGNMPVVLNDEDYTLIALAVRGGGYEQEWASNFTIGSSGLHQGFDQAKTQVLDFLNSYIARQKITGKIKIWITGYSRAAATANLVAGAIDDGTSLGDSVSYTNDDVFAYCFETPAGALTDQVKNQTRYYNIFNIINLSDPVPYVAPSALGFSRYGVDKYLPSAHTIGTEYGNLRDDMLKIYTSLSSTDDYIVDDFKMKKFEIKNWLPGGDDIQITSKDDVKNPYSQALFLSNYVTILAKEFIFNRNNYVENYQSEIREICSVVFGCTDAQSKILMASVVESAKENWGDLAIGYLNPLKSEEKALQVVSSWLKKAVKDAGITDYDEELINSAGIKLGDLMLALISNHPNYFTTAVANGSGLGAAHYPELCYSWLASMDKNYTNTPSDSLNNGGYRIIRINCPVDVKLTDDDGKVVASIVDETPEDLDSGLIYGVDDDGQKFVILPTDQEYNISITAREDAQVNYGISEYCAQAGDFTRNVNFFDIELQADDTIKGALSAYDPEEIKGDIPNGSSASYTLTDVDDTAIEPDSDLSGSYATDAYYNVNAYSEDETKGIVTGSGIHQYGQFAQIQAIAQSGYIFDGWYVNGEKVSTDEIYRVCVTNDINIEARFIKNPYQTCHVLSDWIIEKEATVYSAGSHYKKCTICGETIENEPIPQLKCSKPSLKKVYNIDSYVRVTWNGVKGADLYRVYRKTGTGEYEYIGSTKGKYFNDKKVSAGKTYRYIVRAKNEAGYSEDSASLGIKHLDEPKLKTITNTSSGVKITWGKVTGAEKYNVYRKTTGGKYEYIGTTTKTYYTDKTVKGGLKYYYAIRAKKSDSVSSQSASLSKYYLADPTLKSISNTEYGVLIKWDKVRGREKYNIYRKTSGGSYSKVASTKNTYYTDKTAKSGKKYYYVVKAVKGSVTSASSSAKSIYHLADPILKSIANTQSGVKFTWGKVSGAEKYYVYRKVKGGSYSKIATTKNTYYIDKTAKSGTKYYYVVKAVKSSTTSAYSGSKSNYHLADPTLKTPSSTKSGVKLTWTKVTGAEGYMVYRKTGSGSYSEIATVKGSTKVTYTDKSAKKGKKYTYKVKAYKSKTYSAYSNTKAITDKY